MLRTRHVVLWSMLALGVLSCASPRAQEPASPAPLPEQSGQAQAPGYGMAAPPPPADDESKPPAPTSAAPGADGDQGLQSGKTERDFSSLAEAEAALEKARAELSPPASETRSADKKPPAKAQRPKTEAPAGAAPLAEGGDRCVNACKAFASLKRAASAVCRLAGDTNARCKRAQTIVQENEVRVAVCKCDKNGDGT